MIHYDDDDDDDDGHLFLSLPFVVVANRPSARLTSTALNRISQGMYSAKEDLAIFSAELNFQCRRLGKQVDRDTLGGTR